MKEKNGFLYIIEAIACMSVIMIHRKLPGTIGDILIVLARFAVPLFFLVSGYYNYDASSEKLKERAIRLLKVFFSVSLIYLVCKIFYGILTNTSQIQITNKEIIALIIFNLTNFIGGHLWFVLALIYTYIANIFITKKYKKVFLILPVIPVIGFYAIQVIRPSIGGHILTALTRNWLTIGIPFYIMGSIIREKKDNIKISNTYLLILVIIGMISTITEFLIVRDIIKVKYFGDLYIGTIITVISLFILAVKNPNLIRFKTLENIGMRYSLIIYLIHPLYIEIIDFVIDYFKLNINNIVVLIIVFIFSYLTAYVYDKSGKMFKNTAVVHTGIFKSFKKEKTKSSNCIKTSEILKYRNIWMAIAILWVVLYHAPITINNTILHNIKMFGYGGVDIFLFASGLGCFYSFMKDENTLEFLKRRFKKLMPIYWCFIPFWLILKIYKKGMPFHSIIGNILGIENFTCSGNDFNWYISAIWLFYLLTPVFAKIVEKINSKRKLISSILLLILLSISFWNSKILIITISRIPIFFLGMYFAKVCKEREIISKKKISYLMILSIVGYIILNIFNKYMTTKMWMYALYWYPFILITPGLCISISLISKYIDKLKIGEKILRLIEIIGNNTFEIFLVHILLFGMYSVYNFCSKPVLVLLIIPATVMFKYYCKFIKHLYYKIIKLISNERNKNIGQA